MAQELRVEAANERRAPKTRTFVVVKQVKENEPLAFRNPRPPVWLVTSRFVLRN
jgi:hypothetical protein